MSLNPFLNNILYINATYPILKVEAILESGGK